ncbi:EAL domain-containing protein [Sulfidibacter corallicola]|uniref:EAL domain-containing protein n=1 Tax=Sulfidibacter corallicola TaxID=2818388 RepID=A0A8A4TI67_SULCO|nr:EAL domain-containing protein [Sulfidibacter corallicola]QTD49187.1 EAL domain-containing protein [Sulfidibacter corallicola]
MLPSETEKTLGKVLVVDDDNFTRQLCRTALERHGFKVDIALNGQESLYKFNLLKPDLVIMDVNMPLMDGYQTCKALRQDPFSRDVPIIIITGMNDYDSISKAFKAGATDFLTKPISWVILAQRCIYALRASRAFRALREQEQGLEMAQKIAHIGSWDWKISEKAIFWTEELHHILGFAPNVPRTFDQLLSTVHPEDRPGLENLMQGVFQNATPFSRDHRIIRTDGSERYVHQEVVVTADSKGIPTRIRGIIQDITDRKKNEQEIRRLAYFDSLTGLPNLVFFKESLRQSFTSRIQQCYMGIYFIDLDSFKKINETFGHAFGDQLILEVAKRLKSLSGNLFTPNDPMATPMLLGHAGGGRFLFFINNLVQREQVEDVAKRILGILEQPYLLARRELYVTASIGICVHPHHGNDPDLLMKNVERAMYHAKELGKNNYQFYSPALDKSAEERLALESHLRKALEKEELLLYFQPQMELATHRIIGAEALIRWNHQEKGMISPGHFIPLAEENGLILPIGAWAIQKACEINKTWQQAGYPPITMAVNLSGRQFLHQPIVEIIAQALKDTGLDPQYLEVEITESLMMVNVDESIEILKRLRNMGVKIAIDDFGTGYSSLAYLTKFPIDILKIDSSFVFRILESEGALAITSAIVAMSQRLGLKVIAEGVEKTAHLRLLKDMGCDIIQGYLLARPAAPEDIAPMLTPKYFENIEHGEQQEN